MTLTDVVLVDDVSVERKLVRLAIERSGRFRVVGEGGDGAEAVELAQSLRPPLVVMDLSMPGVDGLEALPRIKRVSPTTKVVILSGLAAADAAASALRLGADAYIEKGLHPSELVAQLSDVIGLITPGEGDHEVAPAVVVDQPGRVVTTADERLLLDPEQLAEVLLGAVHEGVILRDGNGRLRTANPAAARVLGVDGPLDHDGYEALRPFICDEGGRLVPRAQQCDVLALATGTPQLGAVKGLVRPGRPRRWFLMNAVPLVGPADPKPYGVVMSFVDITDMREAHLTRARLAAVVDQSEDAIITASLDGVVQTWNAGAARMFGYADDEIIGSHLALLTPDERRDELADILAHVRGGRALPSWETLRRHRDGRIIDVSVTVSPLVDENGELVGLSKITRDITARNQVRRELEAARAALATRQVELERSRADAAELREVMAHGIAEPLDQIKIVLDDIESSESLPPSVRRALDDARVSAREVERTLGSAADHGWSSDASDGADA